MLAHQGRPGRDDFVSLAQHAEILAVHIDHDVDFVDETYGRQAITTSRLDGGDVLVLENTRMCDEELPEEDPEVKADTEFVRTLAEHVDAYVNDAYSAAHRSHASLVGFPLVLPAYAGRVMETEYEANSSIATREFDGQVTMVVGGTKATDVIDVMNNLGDKVDQFLLGGIAGELFLRAAGYPVGYDIDDANLYDEQWEGQRENRVQLEDHRDQITLAVDLAYEDDGDRAEQAVDDIEERSVSYLDVGAMTVTSIAHHPRLRGRLCEGRARPVRRRALRGRYDRRPPRHRRDRLLLRRGRRRHLARHRDVRDGRRRVRPRLYRGRGLHPGTDRRGTGRRRSAAALTSAFRLGVSQVPVLG